MINDRCTCVNKSINLYRWNEGFKDDIIGDLIANAQKFEDLLLNLTENVNDVDEGVEKLNSLLGDIYEQYTMSNVTFKEHCEYCEDRLNYKRNFKSDKPWITEDCKDLYRQYKSALDVFNRNHSNENRIKLTLAKQKFKRTETRLKRQYKNQQGNMLKTLRRNNPKKFYKKFKRPRNVAKHTISIEQFQEHF